jgi:hypothetical protein
MAASSGSSRRDCVGWRPYFWASPYSVGIGPTIGACPTGGPVGIRTDRRPRESAHNCSAIRSRIELSPGCSVVISMKIGSFWGGRIASRTSRREGRLSNATAEVAAFLGLVHQAG